MRYEITYRCAFAYGEPAAESHNELRACPVTGVGQSVVHARVWTEPTSRVLTAPDYWGTRVDAFGVRGAHEHLVVNVEATVDVGDPVTVDGTADLADLEDADFRDEHREFLGRSPKVAISEETAAVASRVAGDDVVSLAEALRDHVEERIAHVTGVTDVGTSVDDVLEQGRGVCQDRAHVLVALARARGIPARYVSGYLCAGPTGHDTTTHAWVEVAVPGQGWHTLDPSDGDVDVPDRVVIGRGRDYGDVPPLRGTYVGGEDRTLEVSVEIAPVSPVGAG